MNAQSQYQHRHSSLSLSLRKFHPPPHISSLCCRPLLSEGAIFLGLGLSEPRKQKAKSPLKIGLVGGARGADDRARLEECGGLRSLEGFVRSAFEIMVGELLRVSSGSRQAQVCISVDLIAFAPSQSRGASCIFDFIVETSRSFSSFYLSIYIYYLES